MAFLLRNSRNSLSSIRSLVSQTSTFHPKPISSPPLPSSGQRSSAALAQDLSLDLPDLNHRPLYDIDVRTNVRSANENLKISDDDGKVKWVFLGCPGVGKGTYASRLSKLLQIPHISMGDLVRAEVKRDTPMSRQLEETMKLGKLVQDDVIFELLRNRLELGEEIGEGGFILDGFPRTQNQAVVLDEITGLDLIVNLKLREDVLISKCLGRRICKDCGGNFNVANIYLPAENGIPEIIMPPLSPPTECEGKMTIRSDDTEAVVRNRLEIYSKESKPVEEYYRSSMRLVDFNIAGGIPETWPRLLAALNVEERVDLEIQKAA